MASPHDIDPERWLREHGDILYRYALPRVRNPEVAADLVQDTFLAGMKGKERFAGQSTERTWLTSILKHKIIDFHRKAGREMGTDDLELVVPHSEDYLDRKGKWKVGPPEWETDPNSVLARKEFHDILAGCMGKLSEQQQRVFAMRELEHQDADEICETMDISSSNLWVILYRARLQLKKCLESHNVVPGT